MDSFGYKYLVAIRCMTFLHANYITDALNGFCMQQTEFPYVCMVVDDASTDGEQNVIREYIAEHFVVTETRAIADGLGEYVIAKHKINANCDLVYVELSQNLYRERERKLSLIRSWQEMAKYEALCEGDDYWTDPLKLQKQVDFLESHPEVGLCYTDYGKCANTNKPYILGAFTNGAAVPPKDYEEFLLENSYIAPMTWMYRRDVWKNLDLDWVRTDGTLVWALEFYMKSKVAYLPDITAIYREHWGSASKPVNEKGFFRQYKGVLDTELEFVGRYWERVPKELEDKIRSKGYIDLLPHALLANEGEFIEEVRNYFEGKGIHFQQLLSMAEQLNVARAQASHAWNSKAYKLGRAILNPIKRLRRR